MTESSVTFNRFPSIYKETFKAFLPKKKSSVESGMKVEAWLRNVVISREDVQKYAAVCGFNGSDTVPLTYPQVLALPVHLGLGNRPQFPFRLAGMIHIGNRIEQFSSLKIGEKLSLHVWNEGYRESNLGIEADVHTEYYREEVLVWKAITTAIFKRKKPTRSKVRANPELDASGWELVDSPLYVPADQGRRYASVTGDYNPIHLYPWSAKLFGFKRPVVHGMWTLARCLAAITKESQSKEAQTLTVQFRSPLYLPSKVRFEVLRKPGGLQFRAINAEKTKLILQGSFDI